eukprot:1095826_1
MESLVKIDKLIVPQLNDAKNSFYCAIIHQVGAFKEFKSLHYVMRLIINQNEQIHVLDDAFWMTLFTVYFSDGNKYISNDTEFMQYVHMMDHTELSIEISNVIVYGLNANPQITQIENTTRWMVDTLMASRGIHPNVGTFESILNG